MAVAVARALEEERHLVVEAGTGVGKSIAYLAPAVLYAIQEKKKAIVSTHTINLQEQLLHKDIPILKKILPVEFDAALMKGRQNYLCPRRLERALQQSGELFTTSEAAELARIVEWARTTKDGTLSDLAIEPDPKVWAQVCSEAHICTSKACGQSGNCFFNRRGNDCWPGRNRDQPHVALHAPAARKNNSSATLVTCSRTTSSFSTKHTPLSRRPRARSASAFPSMDCARRCSAFTTRARKRGCSR